MSSSESALALDAQLKLKGRIWMMDVAGAIDDYRLCGEEKA